MSIPHGCGDPVNSIGPWDPVNSSGQRRRVAEGNKVRQRCPEIRQTRRTASSKGAGTASATHSFRTGDKLPTKLLTLVPGSGQQLGLEHLAVPCSGSWASAPHRAEADLRARV